MTLSLPKRENNKLNLLFFSFALIFVLWHLALAADTFRLTPYKYSNTEDLNAAVKSLFGENATLADWNSIKNYVGSDLSLLQRFYQLIGLQDEQTALVCWNGERYWAGTDRHYFIQRFDNGAPWDFLIHDQIGSLYLGSWNNITMNVLAKTYDDTSFYRLTPNTYDEQVNMDSILTAVFGWNAHLVDWDELKAKIGDDLTKLAEFYRQIGLRNQEAAWVCKGGERFQTSYRHYFIQRFDEGKPLGFLAFDSIGSLYLGSWYDIYINILAKTRTTFTGLRETRGTLPRQVELLPNYPNPFNPITTIEFRLPRSQFVELTIYNAAGQEVKKLISGQMSPGIHRVQWDGKDLPSGIYFYRLQTGGTALVRKMILLK